MPKISTESLLCRDQSSNGSQHSQRFNAIIIEIILAGVVGWFCLRGI